MCQLLYASSSKDESDLRRCWTAFTSNTEYFVNSSSGRKLELSSGTLADANDVLKVVGEGAATGDVDIPSRETWPFD